MKNECGKTRPASDPYEVWSNGSWTWKVLKKWQADDDKPYARWFCLVTSPFCPEGEMGDVYVEEIKSNAVRIDVCEVCGHKLANGECDNRRCEATGYERPEFPVYVGSDGREHGEF